MVYSECTRDIGKQTNKFVLSFQISFQTSFHFLLSLKAVFHYPAINVLKFVLSPQI